MRIPESVRTVNPPGETPILALLTVAFESGAAVKVTEAVKGRRFSYTHHYPAKQVTAIRTEPRRGTVVILDRMTRVRVSNIVSVTVEHGGVA